jgi:hypothetical protein
MQGPFLKAPLTVGRNSYLPYQQTSSIYIAVDRCSYESFQLSEFPAILNNQLICSAVSAGWHAFLIRCRIRTSPIKCQPSLPMYDRHSCLHGDDLLGPKTRKYLFVARSAKTMKRASFLSFPSMDNRADVHHGEWHTNYRKSITANCFLTRGLQKPPENDHSAI